ncbi:MAG: hypothetical protein J2P37_15195 [Ktedonobacteraceae bacterium]|nr:hypothetical protein [Ktedonobacteraceae bacterium]
MAQKRSLITLTDEQVIAWHRHHSMVLHGYALTLALKAGLSPAEAAGIFVEPWKSGRADFPSQVTDQVLEQQARQTAEVSALAYGEEHVEVERQDDTWLVKVVIAHREPLERYGASLERHIQWVAEQLRQVCEPKGIACTIWLDEDRQYMRFSRRAGS